MAYGAQASGAFNSSSDGSGSGTGRADEMLQAHSVVGDFHTTLQYQKRHNGQFGMDTDYLYGVAASTIYKGWSDYGFQFGLSAAYARFVEITPLLSSLGITGSDRSPSPHRPNAERNTFRPGYFPLRNVPTWCSFHPASSRPASSLWRDGEIFLASSRRRKF